MKRKLTGFTLIELLVVIAIIAILAAILFPVFAQAKEAAKKSRSLAQQKQLGMGMFLYAGDYDDMLCPAYSNQQGGGTWHFLVYPYLKTYQILVTAIDPPNPAASNQNNGWDYVWAYGVMPRGDIYINNPGVASTSAGNGYYFRVGDWPISRALNLVNVRHEGIFGLNHACFSDGSCGGAWGNYQASVDATEAIVPSLSGTGVAEPSSTAMIFDATDPFGLYINWSGEGAKGLGLCGSYWYSPGDNPIGGATPRWGGPKHCRGWRNPGSAGILPENAIKLREGHVNVVFADSSARSMHILNLYKTVPCKNDPSAMCMMYFPLD